MTDDYTSTKWWHVPTETLARLKFCFVRLFFSFLKYVKNSNQTLGDDVTLLCIYYQTFTGKPPTSEGSCPTLHNVLNICDVKKQSKLNWT